MTVTAPKQPTEPPNLDLNLNRTERPESEPAHVFWTGNTLTWVGGRNVNCPALKELGSETRDSLQEHIISFARSGKCAGQTLASAVSAISNSLGQYPVHEFNLAWLVKALTVPSFQSSKGTITSFFIYWNDRYPQAITDDALQFLARPLSRKKMPPNVLSDDPEKSWLTELEYDTLLHSTWVHYDQSISGTQTTLIRLLALQYARRPVQLANLKIGDFRDDREQSGIASERRIHFPGAKDRNALENFRDSKEEVHPVADHLWNLFEIQKHEVKAEFERQLRRPLCESELLVLPLFISQAQVMRAITLFTEHYRINWQNNMNSHLFHLQAATVSKIICWTKNTLGDNHAPAATPPLSHRTGRPIRITATRMRHTRARQLARLGVPKHVLSFWLGHETEKTLESYYNDPAEEARQLNDAMRGVLVPLAMAFTGRLLDNESQATCANNPERTLEFATQGSLKSVGMCGKYSFCATTSVPIPCYRCKLFEPLVQAPHEEVLHALLKRQAEEDAMIKLGGARKLITPINLGPDIRAVRACIDRCSLRKAELGVDHG